jgi:hypothetical protein
MNKLRQNLRGKAPKRKPFFFAVTVFFFFGSCYTYCICEISAMAEVYSACGADLSDWRTAKL